MITAVNLGHIPVIPIQSISNYSKNKSINNNDDGLKSSFGAIFQNKLKDNSQKASEEHSEKINLIKQRISTNYYFKENISELIAEKLMSGLA